ncbi:hypothetical protein SLEP1_g54485 [Rubroshorea leprosula]|uniref:Uncharacterized protein n=1 Tax=Rubroshorea leprosula TaxID=152421 RepID=A0AAV5MDP1_9ROSI|nr:hypothetical protein SLEP1_g54485 [Rubroshorea leprosula]
MPSCPCNCLHLWHHDNLFGNLHALPYFCNTSLPRPQVMRTEIQV